MQISPLEEPMAESKTELVDGVSEGQSIPLDIRKVVITPLNFEAVMMEARELIKRAEAVRQQARSMVLENIRKLMAEYGLTAEDIFPAKKRGRPATRAREAEEGYKFYRDPVSGRIWSGRGRMPQWLREAVAQGRDKESFLMKN